LLAVRGAPFAKGFFPWRSAFRKSSLLPKIELT
jgi:hypothetical protein